MLKSYEAIYRGNQFHWINQVPPIQDKELHVVFVMDIEKAVTNPKKNLHDVLQRAWGCLGKGKSLDDIDQEIKEMRKD